MILSQGAFVFLKFSVFGLLRGGEVGEGGGGGGGNKKIAQNEKKRLHMSRATSQEQ